MININESTIEGNLVADAETGFTNTGKQYTKFTVANNIYGGKDNSGKTIEKASFFGATIWGKASEIYASDLKKGTHVLLIGKVYVDTWESQGEKKYFTKILVDTIRVIPKRSGASQVAKTFGGTIQNSSGFGFGQPDSQQSGQFEDDIPF